MATIYLSLSDKERNGLREIMVRCTISRSNRPRLRSGIYVKESTFIDGVIFSDDPNEAAVCQAKNIELSKYIQSLHNIIDGADYAIKTRNADALARFGEVGSCTKQWIECVFEFANLHPKSRESILKSSYDMIVGMMESDAALRAMQLAEEKRLAAEAARKAEAEAEAARKAEAARLREESIPDIHQLIVQYCEAHDLSHQRRKEFRVLSCQLFRYELYRQLIMKDGGFCWNPGKVNLKDIRSFFNYLRNEANIKLEHLSIYEKTIEPSTWRRFDIQKCRPITASNNLRGSNTLRETFKELRCVCNWIIKQRYTSNNPFEGAEKGEFGVLGYSAPIFLTKEERDQIASFDLSQYPELVIPRDIFVLQCFLGCRVSDLIRLRAENITNERTFSYKPAKTAHNSSAPQPTFILNPQAIDIIRRYKGVDPKGRLLPFIPQYAYNKAIKQILLICGITRSVIWRNPTSGKDELRPISEVASSHTARKTFVASLIRLTRDPSQVGKLSGHVDGSREIRRYYDYTVAETEELTSRM